MKDVRTYRKMILKAASKAVEYLRETFTTDREVEVIEDHGSDVSRKMDLRAEEIIIETLRNEGFDGAIVTEEGGTLGDGPPYAVVDPVDGSLNYVVGSPYFAVSIGVSLGETMRDVETGVICPAFGHPCYWFEGSKVFQGSREFEREEPEKAVFFYGDPLVEREMAVLKGVYAELGRPKLRTPGSIAMDLVIVAKGRALAAIDVRNKLRNVDLAAAVPLLVRVGGAVNEEVLDVKVDAVRVAGDLIAARDEALLKKLLRIYSPLSGDAVREE